MSGDSVMCRCIECKYSIGAEYICGDLYVWCTHGVAAHDRQFLPEYCEPIEAHAGRNCEHYKRMRRLKIREETLDSCVIADLEADGIYAYAMGDGTDEIVIFYTAANRNMGRIEHRL